MPEDLKILTTEERIHAWVDEPGQAEWNFRPQAMSSLWDLVWEDDLWWAHWEHDEEMVFWLPIFQHITLSMESHPLTVHFNLRVEMDWYWSVGQTYNNGMPSVRFASLAVARTVPKARDIQGTTPATTVRDVETLVGTVTRVKLSPIEEGKPNEVLSRG